MEIGQGPVLSALVFRVEERFSQEVHQGCKKAAKEQNFRIAGELKNTVI